MVCFPLCLGSATKMPKNVVLNFLTVKLWNISTGSYIKTLYRKFSGLVRSMYFNQQSKILAINDFNKVELWNYSIDEQLSIFQEHPDAVYSVAFLSCRALRMINYYSSSPIPYFLSIIKIPGKCDSVGNERECASWEENDSTGFNLRAMFALIKS
jgi:WD40 repeat protein